MRISDRAALLMLTGFLPACGGGASDRDGASRLVPCRTGGASEFTRDCAFEPAGADSFVIRHADGGFRRFVILADGARTLVTDGADPVAVGDAVEGLVPLRIGQDEYRIEPEWLKR